MHAVAFSVKRAHLRTVHQLKQVVERFGLTPARYDMLLAIASGVGRSQRNLWRIFHVSRTTVSRMVGALEAKGLVEGTRMPGHPSRTLVLTEKGRRLVDETVATCQRPVNRLFESLYPAPRARRARAQRVAELHQIVDGLARGFGDRSIGIHQSPEPEPAESWLDAY